MIIRPDNIMDFKLNKQRRGGKARIPTLFLNPQEDFSERLSICLKPLREILTLSNILQVFRMIGNDMMNYRTKPPALIQHYACLNLFLL